MDLFAWSSWLLFPFPFPTLVLGQEDGEALLLILRPRRFLAAHQHRLCYLWSQATAQKISLLTPPNPFLAGLVLAPVTYPS